jgi:hypothetical protein
MAHITLKHSSGLTKEVKKGFSWTMLFFGVFVPLIRGDIKWFVISFVLAFLTFGLSWLLLPFFYNDLYIKDLIEKGWKVLPTPQHSMY